MLAGGARWGAGRRGGRPACACGGRGMPPGSVLAFEHASLGSARSNCARRWVLLPSVAMLRCAWRWVLRSPHSFPPPTLASFKFAPALSESELINMQNHSVTH